MTRFFFLFSAWLLVACGPSTNEPPVRNASVAKSPNLPRRGSANPYAAVDISPMDMAYFPTDYPLKKMMDSAAEEPLVRVVYSRPHRQGRKLFGELLKWGEPWRLGANESTEIEFFVPVTVQNKRLPAGRYTLYAIPYRDRWTVVFNSKLYAWGLKFDPQKDVARFEVSAITKAPLVENFTIAFQKAEGGADLVMAWENMEARLPLQF